MRIEELHPFEGDADMVSDPVYRVVFWQLSAEGALSVEEKVVFDAVDFRQVDEWAQSRSPHQYVIYCESPPSSTDRRYFRVAGYEPYIAPQSIERFISDPVEAQLVRMAIERSRMSDLS